MKFYTADREGNPIYVEAQGKLLSFHVTIPKSREFSKPRVEPRLTSYSSVDHWNGALTAESGFLALKQITQNKKGYRNV